MLVEATNERTVATKAQMSHIEAPCKSVRVMNEKKDVLCSNTVQHDDNERELTTIANSVKGVENKTDVASSFISRLNCRVEDIRVFIVHKADEILEAKEKRQHGEEQKVEEM